MHTYGRDTTINGTVGSTAVAMPAGTTARVRMINADNGPRLVTSSVPFRVVAIDGTDVVGGSELSDTFVEIPAGGRVRPPRSGGRRRNARGRPRWPVDRPRAARRRIRHRSTARARFDALAYGTAGGAQQARAALGPVTVSFDYRVGRRVGLPRRQVR